MNSVLCDGTQFAGEPSTGGTASGSGSIAHGKTPGLPWVRTGNPAAAIAAGLVEVWSTIRVLMTRGWVSKTKPFFCAYEDPGTAGLPGPKKPAPTPSAVRNWAVLRRGNVWSAAANCSRPGTRLLHEPSTVRRPYDVRASGIWCGPGPTSVSHGWALLYVAACRSAILICFRMKVRSAAVTVKPFPTGAVAAMTVAGTADIALIVVQPAIRRVVNSFRAGPARRRAVMGVIDGSPGWRQVSWAAAVGAVAGAAVLGRPGCAGW